MLFQATSCCQAKGCKGDASLSATRTSARSGATAEIPGWLRIDGKESCQCKMILSEFLKVGKVVNQDFVT